MTKHFRDYFWKAGIPHGRSPLPQPLAGVSYKIPSDPYYRQISVEKYLDGQFVQLIYDSALFNFRHLNPVHQMSWQKVLVHEEEKRAISHIYNQDDRLILIEEYQFERGVCRACAAYSPHRFLVSIQKMCYQACGDAFDGLILFDSHQHPVMWKKYALDPATKDFSQVLEEQWNMGAAESLLPACREVL
jgi:hypothetical protein